MLEIFKFVSGYKDRARSCGMIHRRQQQGLLFIGGHTGMEESSAHSHQCVAFHRLFMTSSGWHMRFGKWLWQGANDSR